MLLPAFFALLFDALPLRALLDFELDLLLLDFFAGDFFAADFAGDFFALLFEADPLAFLADDFFALLLLLFAADLLALFLAELDFAADELFPTDDFPDDFFADVAIASPCLNASLERS